MVTIVPLGRKLKNFNDNCMVLLPDAKTLDWLMIPERIPAITSGAASYAALSIVFGDILAPPSPLTINVGDS